MFTVLFLTPSFSSAQEFVLTTSPANNSGQKASIDLPGLTGNPLAIIVATPIEDTELLNPRPIAAWYYSGKWYLWNSDGTRMPMGAKYKIQFFAKPGPGHFLHVVTQQNLGAEGTYIDNPQLNDNPGAQVKILQNHSPEVRPYNPNRFEARVAYSAAAGRWYIANVNGEAIGRDAAYNVVIGTAATTTNANTNTTTNTNPNPTNPKPSKDKSGSGSDTKDADKPPAQSSSPGDAARSAPDATAAPKSQEQPPTSAEIMEKLKKANEQLNEIQKDIANPTGTNSSTNANPGSANSPMEKVNETAKMTGFDVKTHGLLFGNSFQNPVFGPPINFTTKGLCGGNSYTVLDYFFAGVEIPKQTYKPAHSSPLHAYLSGRQFTSLLENVDKWFNYHNNPGGARNLEIFNWGLREQLAVLRTYIDRGVPVPLGLKWTGGDPFGKDHQVVAIGYDMGRYKGDVGDYKEDLKIFLYDPSYPGVVKTLVADPKNLEFYYAEQPWDADAHWKSYFVDEKYRAMTPPTIRNPVEFQEQVKDGLVHALRFQFETGSVGLSRSLHVDLKILFTDGTEQNYQNISQNGEWLRNYTETVEAAFTTPRQLKEIRGIVINTNSGHTGGIVVWELDRVYIKAIGGGFSTDIGIKDPPSPPNTFKFVGIPLYLFPK